MDTFVPALTIFILALFVGIEVITKVPPLLHTPLMSAANAISGITLVGTLVTSGARLTTLTQILGFLAVTMATANVVGGFMVTDRMLRMFSTKESSGDFGIFFQQEQNRFRRTSHGKFPGGDEDHFATIFFIDHNRW